MARRPATDDDDILDYTPDGDDDGRSSQTGMLLSIALGLAMVVSILVVGWYFFLDSKGPSNASGGVPVVQADPTPIKSKPADPGGMEVPNQDKLVYGVGHNEEKPQSERLLPGPEKPQEPPKPDPAKMSLATPKPETLLPEPPAATPVPAVPVTPAVVAEPPKPEPVKPEATKPEPAKLAPPQPLKPEKVEPAKPAATPAPTLAAPAKPAEKPAEKPPQVAAVPAPTTAAQKLAKGSYQIQLAALRDIDTAQREWSKMAASHRDLLGGLSPDIVRADLGAKGIFFRLRAGPLDEPSARRVCEELGKRKIGCIVVHK